MKTDDILLARIEKFNEMKGGGIVAEKNREGYSLYLESSGAPIARFSSVPYESMSLKTGKFFENE